MLERWRRVKQSARRQLPPWSGVWLPWKHPWQHAGRHEKLLPRLLLPGALEQSSGTVRVPHQDKRSELPINLNDLAARCASGLVLAKDACSWRGWVCINSACTTPVRDPDPSGVPPDQMSQPCWLADATLRVVKALCQVSCMQLQAASHCTGLHSGIKQAHMQLAQPAMMGVGQADPTTGPPAQIWSCATLKVLTALKPSSRSLQVAVGAHAGSDAGFSKGVPPAQGLLLGWATRSSCRPSTGNPIGRTGTRSALFMSGIQVGAAGRYIPGSLSLRSPPARTAVHCMGTQLQQQSRGIPSPGVGVMPSAGSQLWSLR